MNDTQSRLLTILNSYGDIVELDWKFDSDTIIQELKSVDNWIDGSNHKKGPVSYTHLTLPTSG